jgi:hypothetical protein
MWRQRSLTHRGRRRGLAGLAVVALVVGAGGGGPPGAPPPPQPDGPHATLALRRQFLLQRIENDAAGDESQSEVQACFRDGDQRAHHPTGQRRARQDPAAEAVIIRPVMLAEREVVGERMQRQSRPEHHEGEQSFGRLADEQVRDQCVEQGEQRHVHPEEALHRPLRIALATPAATSQRSVLDAVIDDEPDHRGEIAGCGSAPFGWNRPEDRGGAECWNRGSPGGLDDPGSDKQRVGRGEYTGK